MNQSGIEYVTRCWNPITGCKHECEYCYAMKMIRHRGIYNGVTEPAFHPAQLDKPRRAKTPQVVFCCNMGDIFSPGVSEEWRKRVRDAADAAPWHTYLWLTKNPLYNHHWVRPNWWLGATITGPEDAWKREVGEGENIWYSYEPLFGIPKAENMWPAAQVIIGKVTKCSGPWSQSWAKAVTKHYQDRGTPVFWKNNIFHPGPRELAWKLSS